MDTIEDLLLQIKASTPGYRRTWKARMEAEDESWEESRPRLYAAFMSAQGVPAVGAKCAQCNTNVCTVRCMECAHTYLCSECDTKNHEHGLVFHIREEWVSGFYKPLQSGQTVSIDKDTNEMVFTIFGKSAFFITL